MFCGFSNDPRPEALKLLRWRLVHMRFATLLFIVAAAMANVQNASPEIRDIAQRAYVYAYPIVLLEATRGTTPVNRFTHVPRFPNAEFRQIVRPNADTLYSTAWLDLSREPILIHIPDSAGRFYLLQFMDAWTETFADPGKRTSGTSEAWFALAGPGWNGKLPEHVTRVDAPTNIVWLLGRTQTNGASDYDTVHAFQRGMLMMPLSTYPDGGQTLVSARAFGASPGGTPPDRVKAMDTHAFFAAFAAAMKANPPHAADSAMVRDLARIGLVPGQDFDPSKLTADQLQALEEGVRAASARIESLVVSSSSTTPGWGGFNRTVGRYGTNYMVRAATARLGFGANPPEDAVYINSTADSAGRALNGSNRYRMHFEKTNLPPVRAFWSVTAYDQDGYFIANPINRYAIGDRDALKFNPDGSLDVYVQGTSPGTDRESNWLPSGGASFNLTIRLYWPEEAIINGSWHPPALERLP
jgi:hypothetical protein